ncbi:MAG: DUF1850 domain-containing protein [Bacillota bacterium]
MLALLRPSPGLLVADETGRCFLVAVNGHRFALEFIHSVERTPVREVFDISRGRIILKETHYKSMGAGLPSSGERFTQEGDWFLIKGMDRDLGPLVSVGTWPFTHHVLVVGQAGYELSQSAHVTYQISVVMRPWIFWRDAGGAGQQQDDS